MQLSRRRPIGWRHARAARVHRGGRSRARARLLHAALGLMPGRKFGATGSSSSGPHAPSTGAVVTAARCVLSQLSTRAVAPPPPPGGSGAVIADAHHDSQRPARGHANRVLHGARSHPARVHARARVRHHLQPAAQRPRRPGTRPPRSSQDLAGRRGRALHGCRCLVARHRGHGLVPDAGSDLMWQARLEASLRAHVHGSAEGTYGSASAGDLVHVTAISGRCRRT